MAIVEPAEPAEPALSSLLRDGLEGVRTLIRGQLRGESEPLRQLLAEVDRYRGKMLRPTVCLLCAQAARPDAAFTRESLTAAAVVEMVHLATLVHDDVLDEADLRRGGPTINRLHGNEAAVMLGDYLIASAYALCATLGTPGPAHAIGRASMAVCEGELLQLHHEGDFELDEPAYRRIIEAKTGALVAVACRLGAFGAGAPPPIADAAESFGRALGAAFQIQDDLLDVTGGRATLGKPVGQDARRGKATLPVIHHLRHAGADRRERTLALLRSPPPEDGGGLLAALTETGSIDWARARARREADEAIERLRAFPPSPARDALEAAARAAVERDV